MSVDPKNVEETLIVTVGILGMADTGTGTKSINVDLTNPETAVVVLFEGLQQALGGAMADMFPAFQEYTRTKYGDQGVDKADPS